MALTLSFNAIFEPPVHCGIVGAKKLDRKVLTMRTALMAGACAALAALSAPAAAAAIPEVPTVVQIRVRRGMLHVGRLI